jgi:hypothetical protein
LETNLRPNPDPSDPNGAHPINRLHALISAQLRRPVVDAIDIVPEQARAIPPEFESLAEQLEYQSNYRMWYDQVRFAVDSGQDYDEIRAVYEDIAENSGNEADAVRKALEDALAGRPPEGPNLRDV